MPKNKQKSELQVIWEYAETPQGQELLRQAIQLIVHDRLDGEPFDRNQKPALNEVASVKAIKPSPDK